MSNANFQVGFELKELKVGEKVTFSINYHIFFIFEHEIRTTRLDDFIFVKSKLEIFHFFQDSNFHRKYLKKFSNFRLYVCFQHTYSFLY